MTFQDFMMKQDYSGILDFFSTGQLGELRLGMTVEDVVVYIGNPDIIDSNTFIGKRLTYGCLSLSFQDCLTVICIELEEIFPEYGLPPALNSNWLFLFSDMSLQVFGQFADNQSLQVYASSILDPGAFCLLVAPHYCMLVFSQKFRLQRIIYSLQIKQTPLRGGRWYSDLSKYHS